MTPTIIERYLLSLSTSHLTNTTSSSLPPTDKKPSRLCQLPQIPNLRRSHIIGLSYSQQLSLFSPQYNKFVDFLQRLQFQGSVMSQARSTMTKSFLSIMRSYSYEVFCDMVQWCGDNGVVNGSEDFQILIKFISISLTLILYRLLFDLSAVNVDFYLPAVWYNLPQHTMPSFDDVVDVLLSEGSKNDKNDNIVENHKDDLQQRLITTILDRLPLCTSLYSLINQLKPTAWIHNNENTDNNTTQQQQQQYLNHSLFQILRPIIPTTATNLISPPNQFSPQQTLIAPSVDEINKGIINLNEIIPIPKLPLPELQTLPPIPPFVIFNNYNHLTQITNHPTHINKSNLYLRDLVFEHAHYLVSKGIKKDSSSSLSPLILTEMISNSFGINQFYTYYLGLHEFLTPLQVSDESNTNSTTLHFQFTPTLITSRNSTITQLNTNTIPTHQPTRFNDINCLAKPPSGLIQTTCPFPINFSKPLYFSLLPSNIRYPPIIVAHARMGLLECTHFTFQIPNELVQNTSQSIGGMIEQQQKEQQQQQQQQDANTDKNQQPIPFLTTTSVTTPDLVPSQSNDQINNLPIEPEGKVINVNGQLVEMPDLTRSFINSVSSSTLNWKVFQKSGVSKNSVNFIKKLCKDEKPVDDLANQQDVDNSIPTTDVKLSGAELGTKLSNRTLLTLSQIKQRNNKVIKAARQQPLILHPFAVFAPASICYDDLIKTAASFSDASSLRVRCGGNDDSSVVSTNKGEDNGSDITPKTPTPAKRNPVVLSLHIPLIQMESVCAVSIWGRIQQRYSVGSRSQFEPEPDQDDNTVTSSDNNKQEEKKETNEQDQPSVVKYTRQKSTRYVNTTTGKIYNMSLYPGFKNKVSNNKATDNDNNNNNNNGDLEVDEKQKDTTLPVLPSSTNSVVHNILSKPTVVSLMQPNSRTTLIGNKATLTSILSRFSMYFSTRTKHNTRPKHVDGTGIGIVHDAKIDLDGEDAITLDGNINNITTPTLIDHNSPQSTPDTTAEVLPSDDTAFPWCPETYCLPQAYPLYLVRLMYETEQRKEKEQQSQNPTQPLDANSYTTTSTPSSWILKPSTGSCGKGIRVLTFEQTVDELLEKTNYQCELDLLESSITHDYDWDNKLVNNPPESDENKNQDECDQVDKEEDLTPPLTAITNIAELVSPYVYHCADQILQNPLSSPFFIHPNLLVELRKYITLKLESQPYIPLIPVNTIATVSTDENQTNEQQQSLCTKQSTNNKSDTIKCPWCPTPNQRFVMSAYVSPPFLLKDRKFDLRVYVAVSSLSPLVAWIHRLALVRVCTEPYQLDENNTISTQLILDTQGHTNRHWDELKPMENMSNEDRNTINNDKKVKNTARLGQLTNFSLNKFSKAFSVESLSDFDGSFDLTNFEIQQYYTTAQPPRSVPSSSLSTPPPTPTTKQSLHTLLYNEIYGKATLSRLFAMMRLPYQGLSTVNPSQINVTPESLFTNISLLVTRTLLAIKCDPKLIELYHKTDTNGTVTITSDQQDQSNKLSSIFSILSQSPQLQPSPQSPQIKQRYDPYTNDAAYKSSFGQNASISLLGFDVMVDYKGQCWLAEVNTAPSLDCDADLDRHTKTAVVQQCMQLNAMGAFVLNQTQMKTNIVKEMNKVNSSHNNNNTSDLSNGSLLSRQIDLVTTPPAQWPIRYLQHLAAIELQSLHSQGFRRVIPSVLDQSNQDLLVKAGTRNRIHSNNNNNSPDNVPPQNQISPTLIDHLDEMIQIWKTLPEDHCIAALNHFIVNFLAIKPSGVAQQVITTSSLHRNHCDNTFHPFQPHGLYLQ